ncbi:MAG: hypothetical protein EBU84_14610 [Actinobacteria bacterium]|nr:hypothetical protein [Actinomycetota bacterium]
MQDILIGVLLGTEHGMDKWTISEYITEFYLLLMYHCCIIKHINNLTIHIHYIFLFLQQLIFLREQQVAVFLITAI